MAEIDDLTPAYVRLTCLEVMVGPNIDVDATIISHLLLTTQLPPPRTYTIPSPTALPTLALPQPTDPSSSAVQS
ncbi:hypothetical protein FRB94_002328 [Tulasnella sp. JGI-2019a]|nr:hypothetical protein FRB94_002328 [Tulasnella sp. JGI-2019a]KAG9012750.1 hypothetical protein FRB93_001303 [Tulasnella sp. JGI-2019a]KAG9035237.1 hypothetical protein FRB95_011680 [Tulasnella sp. JGI-2019a]